MEYPDVQATNGNAARSLAPCGPLPTGGESHSTERRRHSDVRQRISYLGITSLDMSGIPTLPRKDFGKISRLTLPAGRSFSRIMVDGAVGGNERSTSRRPERVGTNRQGTGQWPIREDAATPGGNSPHFPRRQGFRSLTYRQTQPARPVRNTSPLTPPRANDNRR
jgi:hypothetical protein